MAGDLPTWALVTDIGNDLAYGADPDELAGWVGLAVERLGRAGADVVLTLLPACTLTRLPRWQYHVLKTALFPGRRLPFASLMARVAAVNDALAQLARRSGAKLVAPEPAWYGLDPIHLHPARRPQVFAKLLGRWDGPAGPGAGAAWRRGLPGPRRYPVTGLRPEHRTLWGVKQRHPQPCGVFADDLLVSLY
jgi:hypothetical protein